MRFKQCTIALNRLTTLHEKLVAGEIFKTPEHLRLAVATSTKFISRYLIHAAFVWLCYTLYLNIPKRKETCLLWTVQMFMMTYSRFNGTRNMLGDLEQKSSMFFWFIIIGNSQKKSCNKETETDIIRTLLIKSIFAVTSPGRTPPHRVLKVYTSPGGCPGKMTTIKIEAYISTYHLLGEQHDPYIWLRQTGHGSGFLLKYASSFSSSCLSHGDRC